MLNKNTEIIDIDKLNKSYLLDTKQAAQVLGVTPYTLCVWRRTRRHSLVYLKIGKRIIRYKVSDILDFMNTSAVYPEQKA